jgi:uncharacterized protein YdaU (DUF1376 family)
MKRPAFQFYPADFLVGTAMMSAEEVGCYIRLLCYQWDSNGLPNDDAQLARLGGCHGNAVALIRHKFGMCQDGLLRNARLEEVRQEQEQYREKQRENAKKRWVGNATAMPPHDSGIKAASNWHMPNACSSSSPSPSNTSTKVEVGAPKKSYLLDEEFWSEMKRHYPNIDVEAESRKMDAWLLARPGRKKTRQFVINWLNKVEPALAPAKVEEVEQW